MLTILGIWIIAIIFGVLFIKGSSDCSGNCYQGRRLCDCEENKDGN